jgi:hypothetical protein
MVVVSVVAVVVVTFVSISLSRQLRIRRHLNRLRRQPIE